jgi:predicted enzyme related to lactoylglutathione lyase
MSTPDERPVGSIMWADLTVEHADQVKAFYKDVVGWTTTDVDMGGYHDYCMNQPADARTVAGVCHARGANAGLPPQWLIYITVDDLDTSVEKCLSLGGHVVVPVRNYGADGRYVVLRDPAGACFALFEPSPPAA